MMEIMMNETINTHECNLANQLSKDIIIDYDEYTIHFGDKLKAFLENNKSAYANQIKKLLGQLDFVFSFAYVNLPHVEADCSLPEISEILMNHWFPKTYQSMYDFASSVDIERMGKLHAISFLPLAYVR